MIKQLERMIRAVCPSCEQVSIFQYTCSQPIAEHSEEKVDLYQCSNCGSDRSLRAILEYNAKLNLPR